MKIKLKARKPRLVEKASFTAYSVNHRLCTRLDQVSGARADCYDCEVSGSSTTTGLWSV